MSIRTREEKAYKQGFLSRILHRNEDKTGAEEQESRVYEDDGTVHVRWLGHACFELEYKGYVIVIDPYRHNYTAGYPELKLKADKILVSHEHLGHNYREGVRLSGRPETDNPFQISSFEVDHDNISGRMRGTCKVHILTADGIKIVHMGDIGSYLTESQIRACYDADAVMIGAGSNTALPAQDAVRTVEEIQPHVVIPMHYRFGKYATRRLEHIENFLYLFDASLIKNYDTNRIKIGRNMDYEIAVLKYIEE